MANKDSRVDAYIAKAPSFAQPILTEVRARVRKALPEVEETIKWNVPFFLWQGKILASMAAFKQHAKIGVWEDFKPSMVDVSDAADLPGAKAFMLKVKAIAQRIDAQSAAPKKAAVKKRPAKKTKTRR